MVSLVFINPRCNSWRGKSDHNINALFLYIPTKCSIVTLLAVPLLYTIFFVVYSELEPQIGEEDGEGGSPARPRLTGSATAGPNKERASAQESYTQGRHIEGKIW